MFFFDRMPYKLQRKKGGYVVKNKETGKEYSSHPIPKARAEAQMRLLEMIEHGGKKRMK